MAKSVYTEEYKRFRIYRKWLQTHDATETDWVMTESFDLYSEARNKVLANMNSPFKPDFEIWKMEDTENMERTK